MSEGGSGLPMSKPMSNAANRGRMTRAERFIHGKHQEGPLICEFTLVKT